LFKDQAASVRGALTAAPQDERRRLAHGLRGSAGGVGAFVVADCAAELEHNPAVVDCVSRLQAAIDEVLAFITKISR